MTCGWLELKVLSVANIASSRISFIDSRFIDYHLAISDVMRTRCAFVYNFSEQRLIELSRSLIETAGVRAADHVVPAWDVSNLEVLHFSFSAGEKSGCVLTCVCVCV